MNIELDHVFVCCALGAPESAVLLQRGLLEGSGNSHPGQGTANRRFFFSDSYLELLWVSDPSEAQSEAVLPTQLWERWSRRASGACPFGIVFRPRADPIAEAPFPCWSYRPSYLPGDLCIEVGRDMALSDPQLFYLPFLRRPVAAQREPRTHPAGIERITSVSVSIPPEHEPSATLERAVAAGLLTLRRGPEYLLELGFDGQGSTALDLRPDLPLLFVPHRPTA